MGAGAEPGPGNAVSLARTPVFDELWETYPHTTLTAWGARWDCPKARWATARWAI